MHLILNDPIDVVIEYRHRKTIPRKLRWDHRLYKITHVHLIHQTMEGSSRVFFFSVSNNNEFFKLRLNTDSLEWRLVEFYSDG